MPEPVVEIPNRPLFRASEVCEIAQIPAYVLKSWEKEFPGLGTPTKPGGPRVYRRTDVEQVMRIKHLLFAEGLTLSGARRRLEGEPKPEEEPLPDLTLAADVRSRVEQVKQELRSLLELLSAPARVGDAAQEAPLLDAAAPAAQPATEAIPRAGEPPPAETPEERTGESEAGWPPVAPAEDSQAERSGSGGDLPLLEGKPEEANPPRTRRSARRSPRHASGSQ